MAKSIFLGWAYALLYANLFRYLNQHLAFLTSVFEGVSELVMGSSYALCTNPHCGCSVGTVALSAQPELCFDMLNLPQLPSLPSDCTLHHNPPSLPAAPT